MPTGRLVEFVVQPQGERLLSVRRGDLRRDGPQRAGRADSRPSGPRPGTGNFDPKQSLVAGNRDREKCAEADLGDSVEARPSKWVRSLGLRAQGVYDTAARELSPKFISSLIENRLQQQEPSSGSSRNAGSEWGGTDSSPNKSTVIYGQYGGHGGLAGVGILAAPGPVAALILSIVLIGIGIGAAWAFVLQRVMSVAEDGEENIAAAGVATVQQAGIALGAAIAGLVANASGLNNGLEPSALLRASLAVPLALAAHPWPPVLSECD